MAARARGRGSRYGIDGTVLETSLGSVGTVLETDTPEAGRCKPYLRNAPSGAGTVQSRAAGAQEGFSRCRTAGETAGRPGADLEFCARCRAASMAHGDAQNVSVEATMCGCRTNWSLCWRRPILS